MRHSWETACGGIESRENSCVCHPGDMVRVKEGQLLLLSGHCDGGVSSCPSAMFASVTTRPLSPPCVALTFLSEVPPFLPDPRTSQPCPLEPEVISKPPETQVLPDVSFACSSGLSLSPWLLSHPLWPWSWVVASLLLSVASPSLSCPLPMSSDSHLLRLSPTEPRSPLAFLDDQASGLPLLALF